MSTNVGKISKTVFSLIQPYVQALASRLFTLTAGRLGSKQFAPTVGSFYETGIVTMLYEHLLMSPVLASYEIRHEMPYRTGGVGSPPRVDLWLRPVAGGLPYLIEAGDFTIGKVHTDLAKIGRLNPTGQNWFLAFFRKGDNIDPSDPWGTIQRSMNRANGLDSSRVGADQRLVTSFEVYRPNGEHDVFGAALLRGL